MHVMFVSELLQNYLTYPHIIGSVSCTNGMNFECHSPGVIWNLFRLDFLHNGKSKDQPFLRAKKSVESFWNFFFYITTFSRLL